MREDTNIKGADTESDFWLIIYSGVNELSGALLDNIIWILLDYIFSNKKGTFQNVGGHMAPVPTPP